MNILFVTFIFPPQDGGISIFDYHICKELVGRGHKIIVITNSVPGSENFDSQQDFPIRRLTGKIRAASLETIYRIMYGSLK